MIYLQEVFDHLGGIWILSNNNDIVFFLDRLYTIFYLIQCWEGEYKMVLYNHLRISHS